MDIIQLYIEEKMSTRQIGNLIGRDHKTVQAYLKNSGIQLRNKSEAKKNSWAITVRETKKYFCPLCNRERNRKSDICRECYISSSGGEKSPSWSGGKPHCQKCDKELSTYGLKTLLCRSCHDQVCGPEHWNWKGGSSSRNLNSKEYKEWRMAVFTRDNFTCRYCGDGGYLHAHHKVRWIDSVELRYNIDNGLTLCKECHYNLHWGHKEASC